MPKKVVGYEQKLVRKKDALGRVKERMGFFPIYEELPREELTTFEVEMPTFEPIDTRTNLWPFGNGRER